MAGEEAEEAAKIEEIVETGEAVAVEVTEVAPIEVEASVVVGVLKGGAPNTLQTHPTAFVTAIMSTVTKVTTVSRPCHVRGPRSALRDQHEVLTSLTTRKKIKLNTTSCFRA